MRFDRVVFWSGIWNVGLGLILITPPITEILGVHIPNPTTSARTNVGKRYRALGSEEDHTGEDEEHRRFVPAV